MPSDEIIETMARAIYAANPNLGRVRVATTQPGIYEWQHPTVPWEDAVDRHEICRKEARVALSAAEAAGWVMVPRENVQAMIDRLQFCLDTFGPVQDQSSEAADLDDWRAMLEARP